MKNKNPECKRCGLLKSTCVEGRWKNPLCRVGRTEFESHIFEAPIPMKIEKIEMLEITDEARKYAELSKEDFAHNILVLADKLNQVIDLINSKEE